MHLFKLPRVASASMAVTVAFALASCTERAPAPSTGPSFWTTGDQGGTLTICKVGTPASFDVFENGVLTQTVSLAAGECRLVADAVPVAVTASATEIVPTGTVLDSIVVSATSGAGTTTTTKLTGTNTVSGGIGDQTIVATFYNRQLPPPGEGCTPGFWKTHLSLWPVSPSLDFDATFGVNLFNPNITLERAVNLGGGGVNRLARHGTAAYLNSLSGFNFPFTTAQVIALVQAGNADALAAANELGCPMD